VGKKNRDGQWYELKRAVVDNEVTTMGAIAGETAILRASIYNKRGEEIMMVVEVPMDGIPLRDLERFRQTLTLQNLCPILFVPPHVKFLELAPMSDVEVRRMMTEVEARRKEEAEKAAVAAEPSRIITP
jgi:hypothetical protein